MPNERTPPELLRLLATAVEGLPEGALLLAGVDKYDGASVTLTEEGFRQKFQGSTATEHVSASGTLHLSRAESGVTWRAVVETPARQERTVTLAALLVTT